MDSITSLLKLFLAIAFAFCSTEGIDSAEQAEAPAGSVDVSANLQVSSNLITPLELAEALERGGSFVMDVRTYAEFYQGRINPSTNVPVKQISLRAREIPLDEPIIVVAASDQQAGEAFDELVAIGVSPDSIWLLDGGTQGWVDAGYELKPIGEDYFPC